MSHSPRRTISIAPCSWVLHQPVTTLCSSGDLTVLPGVIDAAERYQEIDEAAQLTLLRDAPEYGDIFVNA